MKIVCAFALALPLLLLAGCIGLNSNLTEDEVVLMKGCIKEVKEKDIETDNEDFDKQSVSIRDYCYDVLAHEEKKPTLCSYIGHGELRGDCFFRYAVSTKDQRMCEKIKIGTIKRNCEMMAAPKKIEKSSYSE